MRTKIMLSIGVFLYLFSQTVIAQAPQFFLKDTLTFSGSIGYTQFEDSSDHTLKISNYIYDLLTRSRQHHKASYHVSIKQALNIHFNPINKLMLGPAVYVQKAIYSGQVWELASSEFYNYNYRYTSNNALFLLESDIYLNPIVQIHPFISLGAGFGVAKTHYNDYVLLDIIPNGELHHSDNSIKPVFELGAGFAKSWNTHWTTSLRYTYLFMGAVNTSVTQLQPLCFNLSSQNVFLGFYYVF